MPPSPSLHRHLICLEAHDVSRIQAAQWCAALPADARVVWVGGRLPVAVEHVPLPQADSLLGRDLDALVFDAVDGLSADALGAASGAVRGGGVLLLILPASEGAPASLFLHRLRQQLHCADVPIMGPDAALPSWPVPKARSPHVPAEDPCLTEDQRDAVQALQTLTAGRTPTALVVMADRGRGKTAALGIAAARLMMASRPSGDGVHIGVTAPRLSALGPLFEQAVRLLPDAVERGPGWLRLGSSTLQYFPPDSIPEPVPGLMLVDEAAGIPVQWLNQWLEACLAAGCPMAFTGTVHGYEGGGRGFAVRFLRILAQRVPDTRHLHLETPARWAADDPLEALMARCLLLDAQAVPDASMAGARPEACGLKPWSRERLAGDEVLLREIFGLLTLAHYRTRPSDLQRMLDDPGLRVVTWVYQGRVAAVALVADEGELDAGLCRAVWQGERRPQGHFLPVSLMLYGGMPPEGGRLRYRRVVRIAVHPAAQGRGLGRALVQCLVEKAREDGIDLVGAGFGGTTSLLRFWSGQGFMPVRVGVKPEVSSGGWAVTVLQALTAEGQGMLDQVQAEFGRALPLLLSDPLRTMAPDLAASLFHGLDIPPLSREDRRVFAAFAHGRRVHEACLPALRAGVIRGLAGAAAPLEGAGTVERDALVMRVVQQRPWEEVARYLGVSGRKPVIAVLRRAVACLPVG
ncbi:tRNA(Met) cytidine acetyltransferase TmcA [Ectothiorhodospira lacustris]|uniref:tRNA(Met) cytidine acetyltransferase TmcA n=1 Tax=Ectothiorhodospira lacustris TaxID=2899127 RepID=UPI001EE8015E|nr:GNAT family N-acetyltransferase [Ectothiorhodospira lacustris]MCG5501689.1 GNAT family N-acetyltransferase [Ectothiorhodospira lacustris]